jgi:hypothetical protein
LYDFASYGFATKNSETNFVDFILKKLKTHAKALKKTNSKTFFNAKQSKSKTFK